MRGYALTLAALSTCAIALGGCADFANVYGGVGASISQLLVRDAANWAEPENYQAVHQKTERDVDVRGRPTYRGPIAYVDNDVRGHSYFMRAILPRDWPVDSEIEPDVLQIYVIASLASETGLDRAAAHTLGDDDDSDENSAIPIDLEVTRIYQAETVCTRGICPVREDVGVNLTLEDLQLFAATGIKLEIAGERGFIDLEIPAPYIAAFQDRVLEHRAD